MVLYLMVKKWDGWRKRIARSAALCGKD